MRRASVLVVAVFFCMMLAAPPASATFPGTNGKIAFGYLTAFFLRRPSQIFTIDPDGGNRTALTSGPGPKANPAWSADGTRIAFVQIGARRIWLVTMNADGSGRRIVLIRNNIEDPTWSPDGTRIAFDRFLPRQGSLAIFVVNADGSGLKRLSPRHSLDVLPDWSPDGSLIAFDNPRTGKILTMDPDGGNRTVVVGVAGRAAFAPSWSPDGSKIVFLDQSIHARSDIFVVNADGSGRTRLTRSPRRWEFAPAFSPDGTKIVYCRTTNRRSTSPEDLWVMSADGSSRVRITDTPLRDEFAPSWQAL